MLVIFSHGKESGPWGSKIRRLADAAATLGFEVESLDYKGIEDQFKDFQPPKPFIADSPGQHVEWLNAIKNAPPTGSPFSYAGPLSEANHLGNVTFRAGSKILWDAQAMRITNHESANRFISRQPRNGWSLG